MRSKCSRHGEGFGKNHAWKYAWLLRNGLEFPDLGKVDDSLFNGGLLHKYLLHLAMQGLRQ